jgi:hypothetical protein
MNRPLNEFTEQAIHLLTQAMGPVDTMRFLGQFSNGAGNYTEERRSVFDHLQLDNILADLNNNPV